MLRRLDRGRRGRAVTAKILPGRKLLIPRLKRARSRNLKRIFDSSRGSIAPIIRQANGVERQRSYFELRGAIYIARPLHFRPFYLLFAPDDRNEKREDWCPIKILDFVYRL